MSQDSKMDGYTVILLFASIIVVGILSGIFAIFETYPIKNHNKKINNSAIELQEISYADSLVTSESGLILDGSIIPSYALDPFVEYIKELFYNNNIMDYSSKPFNINMDYGYEKIEITGEPEIIFKTFNSKNLIHINFSGKVFWYTDVTKTSTKEVDANFYYIGYNLKSNINGELSVESGNAYICDKNFTDGYKIFEHNFRSSYYLNGHALYKLNEYDKYKTWNIFSEYTFPDGLSGYAEEIYNASDDCKRFIANTLPIFMNKKSKSINYGYLNTEKTDRFLLLESIFYDEQRYVGSTLYSGNGKIKLKNKTLEFNNNLYICKFYQSGKGFNIAIATDCKIQDNKIHGNTVTYSKTKTTEEEMKEILYSIEDYAQNNLNLVFEDNTCRWKK